MIRVILISFFMALGAKSAIAQQWAVTPILPKYGATSGYSFVSEAVGLSDDGVVVGYTSFGLGAFIYDQSTYGYGLLDVRGLPDNDYPKVFGVSKDGYVFGGVFYRGASVSWEAEARRLGFDYVGGVVLVGPINAQGRGFVA